MSSEKDDVKAPEEELSSKTSVDTDTPSDRPAGKPVDDSADDPSADPELYDVDMPVASEEAVEQAGEALAASGGGDGGSDTPDDPDKEESSEDPDGEDDGETAEDEEDGSHMSLLDHLGELRVRLTRSFIAIAVGMVACYSFAEQMFNILMQPMIEVFHKQAAKNPMLTPEFYQDFGRVLKELLAEKGFQHSDQMQLFIDVLQKSLTQVVQEGHFQYTYPAEAFFSHIKISIVAGLFLVSPYVFAQIWGFIAPGLYSHERKWMIPMAMLSGLFFTGGALFGYFQVFPYAFDFFAGFSTEGIQFTPKLNEYLSFCLKLLFAFGFVFELPLFIFFLARMGMVSSTTLRKKRKYAILIGFVLAAVLTPPDPFTQCLMAGPLIVLYEVGIWVAYFFGKKEKRHLKKQAEEEAKVQAEMDAAAEKSKEAKSAEGDEAKAGEEAKRGEPEEAGKE